MPVPHREQNVAKNLPFRGFLSVEWVPRQLPPGELFPRDNCPRTNRCPNNQAEHLAILEVLEQIHGDLQHMKEVNPKKATMYTDSRITIDSINNPSNHNYLMEEIRKATGMLKSNKWRINFKWIQGSCRNLWGNELADRLAEAAAQNNALVISFDKIPKSTVIQELTEGTNHK